MAGLPWIELATDLPRHRKSVALALKIGDPRAWAYPAALWMWCAEALPAGYIDGSDAPAVLEHAMGWTGESGRLLQACIDTGFIDKENEGYSVHGWAERASAHIEKRKKDAERQAARRERIREAYSVTRESRGCPSESRRNNNSNPNPNPNPNIQGQALDYWNATVWPKLSSDAPPKAGRGAMKMLHARCKEYGLDTVKAAMDRVVTKLPRDAWLREHLTLQLFVADTQFPKFLQRNSAPSTVTAAASPRSSFTGKAGKVDPNSW